jgi:two-component system, NtrC family, nitrogen regulation sensor histidine kinase NtrY
MGYKRVTLSTISSMVIITLSSLAAGYLTAFHMDPWFLLLLIPVPLAAIFVMHNFNQSNRQIAFFFEAIRNEDASLKFPTSIRQKSLRHLYKSLNDLNERITEIKLQNEYLEQYYRSFIQHAGTGLMSINQDNEVEIMNDKAFEYAGIPSFTPLHLIPLRNPDLINFLVTFRPGESNIYRRFMGDAQVNLLIRTREIRYGGKVSKLISLQDIRHELDEKEIDSWQKLIRVLTHEIMNSIAPIVSLTGTLQKFFMENGNPVHPGKVDEEIIDNVIQGLDTIGERGNGLVNFVNSYRELTRIPKPEFESFGVHAWLDQIMLLLHQRMEQHQIETEIRIDEKAREITGDKRLLTQVVINIINNAMEALMEVPENRKIRITVDHTRQNQRKILISNNGPMIPAEAIDKIFIPFFTTKENGSGIGLSLSRQILRLHRGYIHAESSQDSTRFIITL